MGSDRARKTYDENRKYRRVLFQQGRVVLEADLNEAQDIAGEEARKLAQDMVGRATAPRLKKPALWTKTNKTPGPRLVEAPETLDAFDFVVDFSSARPGDLPKEIDTATRVQYSAQQPPPLLPRENPGTEFVYLQLTRDVESMKLPLSFRIERLALGEYEGSSVESAVARAQRLFENAGQHFDLASHLLESTAKLHVRVRKGALSTGLPSSIRIQISQDGKRFLWRAGRTVPLDALVLPNGIFALEKSVRSAKRKRQFGEGRIVEIAARGEEPKQLGQLSKVARFDNSAKTLSVEGAGAMLAPGKKIEVVAWENEQDITPNAWTTLVDAEGDNTSMEILLAGNAFIEGDYWIVDRITILEDSASRIQKRQGLSTTGPRRWAYSIAFVTWSARGVLAENTSCLPPAETAIAPEPQKAFTLGPGVLYMAGYRAELLREIDGVARAHATSGDPLTDLIFLEVEEREISAVEDPVLRESALGGPDTAQRLRVIEYVGAIAAAKGNAFDALKMFYETKGRFLSQDGMLVPASRLKVKYADITASETTSDPNCEPLQVGGYLGSENQMIRVQISPNAGKILWAWDGASAIYRAMKEDETTLRLQSDPVDEYHNPKKGQIAEILLSEVDLGLASASGGEHAFAAALTGVVSRIEHYEDRTLTLAGLGSTTLSDLQSKLAPGAFLYVRIWENEHDIPSAQDPAEVTLSDVNAQGIGFSLEIQSPSRASAGDYWLLALRPNTPREVDPPRYLVDFQLPDGPRRFACPIAVVSWHERILHIEEECLLPFDDLVTLSTTVDKLVDDVEELQDKVELLEGRVGQLENDVNELDQRADALEDRADALEGRADVLESDVADLKAKDGDLQEQVDELKAKDNDLQGQVDGLKAKDNDLQGQVDGLKAKDSVLEDDVEALKVKTDSLQQQIDDISKIGGGCCSLVIGPHQAAEKEGGLQAIIDELIESAMGLPAKLCLLAGEYALKKPIRLGRKHSGLTLESCQGAAALIAKPSEGPTLGDPLGAFRDGMIVVFHAENLTLRGLRLHLPVLQFGLVGLNLAGIDRGLLSDSQVQWLNGLGVSIGIRPVRCGNLKIQDCTFRYTAFSDAVQQVFGVGVFAASECWGLQLEGCSFLHDAEYLNKSDERPPLLFGYLQAPSIAVKLDSYQLSQDAVTGGTFVHAVLDEAQMHSNLFAGLGVGVLCQANTGNLRMHHNRVRDCHAGFCLIGSDTPASVGISAPQKFDILLTHIALLPNMLIQVMAQHMGISVAALQQQLGTVTKIIKSGTTLVDAQSIITRLANIGARAIHFAREEQQIEDVPFYDIRVDSIDLSRKSELVTRLSSRTNISLAMATEIVDSYQPGSIAKLKLSKTAAETLLADFQTVGVSGELIPSEGTVIVQLVVQDVYLMDPGPDRAQLRMALTEITGSLQKANDLLLETKVLISSLSVRDAVMLDEMLNSGSVTRVVVEHGASVPTPPPTTSSWFKGSSEDHAYSQLSSADDTFIQMGLTIAKSYPLPEPLGPEGGEESNLLAKISTPVERPAQWTRFIRMNSPSGSQRTQSTSISDAAFVWYQFPYERWWTLLGDPIMSELPVESPVGYPEHLHRVMSCIEMGYATDHPELTHVSCIHIADNDIGASAGHNQSGAALLVLGDTRDSRGTLIVSSNRMVSTSLSATATSVMLASSTFTGNIFENRYTKDEPVCLVVIPGPAPFSSAITGNNIGGQAYLPSRPYPPPLNSWLALNS